MDISTFIISVFCLIDDRLKKEEGRLRRGGGDSAGRLGLLPRREAPRGGECRPWHCSCLLHGGCQHRPHPRRHTPRPRIQLVKPGWGTQVVHPREGKELPLCLP